MAMTVATSAGGSDLGMSRSCTAKTDPRSVVMQTLPTAAGQQKPPSPAFHISLSKGQSIRAIAFRARSKSLGANANLLHRSILRMLL
jgi:hypothetical protein